MPADVHPWFALRVRSRFEKAVGVVLRAKRLEEYVPLYFKRAQWSDRVKTVELPLFPGYVFARFDPEDRIPILNTPGVVAIVSFGPALAEVEESDIAAVRRVIASGLALTPWPYLAAGDQVRIEHGSLDGLEGILVRVKDQYRVVVSVHLLQRSVAVEVDRDRICPSRSRCHYGGSVGNAPAAGT